MKKMDIEGAIFDVDGTLSSAIACGLAAGKSLEDSVREAKAYITGALKAGLNLGQGNGPLNHMYALPLQDS